MRYALFPKRDRSNGGKSVVACWDFTMVNVLATIQYDDLETTYHECVRLRCWGRLCWRLFH